MQFLKWFREYFRLKDHEEAPDKADIDIDALRAAYNRGFVDGQLFDPSKDS